MSGHMRQAALAYLPSEGQISPMATAASTSSRKSGGDAKKVARSAVTGRFVLEPASKGGKITIAKARSAANTVLSSKK